MTEETRLI